MMFDTAAYFGQPNPYASQFTPQGLPGVFPGQYGQLPGQALAACLAAQQAAQQIVAQQQLAAQLGLLAPTPFGVQGVFGSPTGAYGQSISALPALLQSILGPQALFGSPTGHFGPQPFLPALGIHGLNGVPSWQSIGAWPAAQVAGQFAGGMGRSFQPFQPVPQMAYAG
jgi:hypothetical protein